jgi:hypothetical protein
MKKTLLIFLCLGLLLPACLKDTKGRAAKMVPSPSALEGQNLEKIDEFMRHGPAFPVGNSLEEITKNFGTPLKKSVEERRNIHDQSQTDEIQKLFYGGLYFEVYRVKALKKDIILLLEVTGDKYPIAFGLGVGSRKEKVRAALGKPNEEKDDLWRYFASDLVMGSFEFVFQNNAVVSIKWYYSID